MAKDLGRRVPADWQHVEKYSLAALPQEDVPVGVPAVIGVNWYSDFDYPTKVGNRYFIGLDPNNLGSWRGGHAICVLSQNTQLDQWGWYRFYNQNAGSCVGFSSSRMMSLLNRKRYEAYWLWDQCKVIDEWTDTNPGDEEGTSVRAAMDILRLKGHVPVKRGDSLSDWSDDEGRESLVPVASEGISANRWATTVDELLYSLNSPVNLELNAVPLLNSWGEEYPHKVWLNLETLQKLLDEYGECALITDY